MGRYSAHHQTKTATSEDFYLQVRQRRGSLNSIVDDLIVAEAAGLSWMDGTGRANLVR
nr:hypothetical protein [Haliscomenobacter sp.]